MKPKVDLYDSHYANVESDVYREVRFEAFGEDMGQTSWITAEECDEFCRWLGLEKGQKVLEVACGSGGVSLRLAERLGVSVVGVDINEAAVSSAIDRAKSLGLDATTEFRVADASKPLPFSEESFDAIFCNDSINHLPDRERVLNDWVGLLRPGGRCLFTDPIVVTGSLSNAEIEMRSSIGFFLFTTEAFNEAVIRSTGFRLVFKADVTESVSRTSRRWFEARLDRKEAICRLEGEEKFDELQQFLSTVHVLSLERRLSRYAFMAEKPGRRGQ